MKEWQLCHSFYYRVLGLISMSWLFFFVFLWMIVLIVEYSWGFGITPTPTSFKVKRKVFQILPENLRNGLIFELGSGWGTLAFALAQHFPHHQVYAYEISPVPYFFSKLISIFLSYSNLHIKRKNFFEISLKDADLIVCYLYSEAMSKLKVKFENELHPGAFVLSHTFAIPGWVPIKIICADDLYQTPIYLYQVSKSTSRTTLN